jgi:hypothetical protein
MRKRLTYLEKKHAKLKTEVDRLTGNKDADPSELKKLKFEKYLAKTQIAEISRSMVSA